MGKLKDFLMTQYHDDIADPAASLTDADYFDPVLPSEDDETIPPTQAMASPRYRHHQYNTDSQQANAEF